MKLIVARVYFHTITEKNGDGVIDKKEYRHGQEVSHTSLSMVLVAAETEAQLSEALPHPPAGPPGTMTRNVVVQVHKLHKEVLYMPEISTRPAKATHGGN
jgi:hypothetical protein